MLLSPIRENIKCPKALPSNGFAPHYTYLYGPRCNELAVVVRILYGIYKYVEEAYTVCE